MKKNETTEFFIGYLPMPVGHRGFLRWLVPTVLWGCCTVSALIAAKMSAAGSGDWDLSNAVELRGLLIAQPYPAIRITRTHGAGGVEDVLLVEEGKFPIRGGLDALAGQSALVRGTILNRDGMRMMELMPFDDGLEVPDADGSATVTRSLTSLGRVSLTGEVVDSKCYLGAMKPGRGVTHRGCATLCVRGGIPPALVVGEHMYFVTDERGARANALAAPHMGIPVQVEGEAMIDPESGIRYLRVAPGSILHR